MRLRGNILVKLRENNSATTRVYAIIIAQREDFPFLSHACVGTNKILYAESVMMPTNKINLNKLTKVIFTLLILLSVGVCFALTSTNAGVVAFAEDLGSNAVNATISDFQETIETGASITLKATASDSATPPTGAFATASAEQTAVISLTGDLWEAVKSGRITASLLADGSYKYSTIQGEAGEKSGSYTVSGAMTGSGKFSTKDDAYTDKVLVENVALKAENGNEIQITYSAKHTAFMSNTNLERNNAESSIDCEMSFKLKLSFKNVEITINSSNGGQVKDAIGNVVDVGSNGKTMELGFSDVAKYTAVPNDGYYFLGWKKVDSNDSNIPGTTLNLGKAVSIGADVSPTYKAEFAQIVVAQNEDNHYEYTGSSVGPVVRNTAYIGVYYVTHHYTGTTLGGESVDLSSEGLEDIVASPISTGNYNYTCVFHYRKNVDGVLSAGEEIGRISIDFDIKKNTPTVVRGGGNLSSITLSFGNNLEDLDLSYEANNSVDTLVKINGILELYLGEEKVELTKLLPISEGGTDYTLRFTPNDTDNYNVVDSILKVYVQDNIGESGTNLDSELRYFSIEKSIATEKDDSVANNFDTLNVPEGGEVVKISLRATMLDESGQYFFMGWRIGTKKSGNASHGYTYVNSGKVNRDENGALISIEGLAYDYYFPHYSSVTDEKMLEYTSAIFEAVFIKDTTCGTGEDALPGTLTINYSGSPTYTTPKFSPSRANYQFGYGDLIYYHESAPTVGTQTIPTAIGTHRLTYDIINTGLSGAANVVVDTRVIEYVITTGNLIVTLDEATSRREGGYDRSTGWAQRLYYTLSVEGLLSGSVESYYYSLDNGNTWVEIEETPALISGCPITFVTPEVVNDTQVFGFIFMATHSVYGADRIVGENTYKLVAGEEQVTIAKIDTYAPSLSDLVETTGLNGAWTNDRVDFSAKASYGGSGAGIYVCYEAESSDYVRVDSNISFKDGYDLTKTIGEEVQFSINREYSGNLKIRLKSSSGLIYDETEVYIVNIDLTIPVFTSPEKDHVANTAQGWIGVTTKVTFDIISAGGAAPLEPTAHDIDGNPVELLNVGEGKYRLEINDSRAYTIVAIDEAGNLNQLLIQEKIDVEDVEYTFDESSFIAGADKWAKLGSALVLNVNMGASGARIRGSINGGDYLPLTEFVGGEIGAVKKEITLSYEIPYHDGIQTYAFQIETGTGRIIDVPFGLVQFDIDAPVYTILTDLSAYQGANWTASEDIYAEFTAVDDQGSVNSGTTLSEISVDNGGAIVQRGNNLYALHVDKCTPFTVSVKDKAGNEVTFIIQANVDIVTPDLTLKAYVGGGNPEDENEVPEEGDYKEYDFNGWITKAEAEPWVRIEFTINLTASGSKLEYSNDNGVTWKALTPTYLPAEGEVEGEISTRTYIKVEQNRKYSFRLATGSGKYFYYESANDLFVRIDFTSPTLATETFRVGSNANFDLKNVWVAENGQYRVRLQDTLTGSGVDNNSPLLREYDWSVSDAEILNGNAQMVERIMEKSGDAFIFNMSEAKKYVLVFKDLAGNEYVGEPFLARIDKTAGFSLDVIAKVGEEELSDAWLQEDDVVIFIGNVTFTQGTGFGPSGGEMQFSIDGGLTYNACSSYQMEVSEEQYNAYEFRVITGAGISYELDKEFLVKKDNATPTLTSSLTLYNGNEYLGDWTNKNLRFTLTAKVGMAGGELYYGIGESRETAVWNKIMDLPKNYGLESEYYYNLTSSTSGTYYFKVVSLKEGVFAESVNEHVVKLDNTEVNVEVNAENAENGDLVTSGEWVPSDVRVYPSINTIGESGIDKVFVKIDNGSGYGEYVEVTSAYYVVMLLENTQGLVKYTFKVVSVSGMEGESEEFMVGRDNVMPEFTYALNGNKLPVGNLYADWYVSNVEIVVTLAEANTSSHQVYYAYKDNVDGAVYSDWIAVGDTFTLSDEGYVGGLDRFYKVKIVTESGLEVEKEERYLPIDTSRYTVTVKTFVGEVESDSEHKFANVEGMENGASFRRGDSLMLVIAPEETYKMKSLKTTIGDDVTEEIINSYDEESRAFVIGSNSVEIDVYFYKEVTVVYSEELLHQYLQNGTIQEVTYSAGNEINGEIQIEEGFDSFFGAFVDKVSKNYTIDDKTFLRAEQIGSIGRYSINLTSNDENFVIMNPSAEFIIAYFGNEGSKSDPYIVRTREDLYHVEDYMDANNAYFGTNVKKAYFKQEGDITLLSSFTPICGVGKEFEGTYDGNGYEINAQEAFVVSADFGLFQYVQNGASIINLGIRYDVVVKEGNLNVGLVASNMTDSGISSVYVMGNVTAENVSGVNVGGMVGNAKDSMISQSFIDVSIEVDGASGNFGGAIGKADNAYFATSYSVSKLTLTDVNEYSSLAMGEFAYAGAVVGYQTEIDTAMVSEANASFYLNRNTSVNQSVKENWSLGNEHIDVEFLRHNAENMDFFASSGAGNGADVKIINVNGIVKTVKSLVQIRIDEEKLENQMEGNGTEEDPFLIDSLEKLDALEIFPWATFKQTNDITLSGTATSFATNVPFVGVYDGAGYAIIGASIVQEEGTMGGLFGIVHGTIRNLKIVDIAYERVATEEDLVVGGVVGMLLGGSIENVVVTGTIEVECGNPVAFVGGIAGLVRNGTIANSISVVNVKVSGPTIVVGGLFARIEGDSIVTDVANLSAVSVHYTKKASIGSSVGEIVEGSTATATLQRVYHLTNNAYANDKSMASILGYNGGANLNDVTAKTYDGITSTLVGGVAVKDTISTLYPFEGEGTKENPFLIDSFLKLKLVGNYMYANFMLTDNVVIGDLNDDGKLDATDGYDYNYNVIGDGATFTGSLDGDGYAILGLTDSLFAVNAGAIRDITLNVNYKVYASEKDIPESEKVIDASSEKGYVTTAKVAGLNEEIVFGALAKINSATGSLIRVNVAGDVYVRTNGNSKVILGGVVGIDVGGQIVASQMTAKMVIRASQVVVGGVVGEIKISDRALGQMATNYVMVNSGIDVGGGNLIAGAFVGRVGVESDLTPAYTTETEVIVNGEIHKNKYVGFAK